MQQLVAELVSTAWLNLTFLTEPKLNLQ